MEDYEIIEKMKSYLLEKQKLDVPSAYAITKKMKDELWEEWNSDESPEEEPSYDIDDEAEEDIQEEELEEKPKKSIVKKPAMIKKPGKRKSQGEIDEGDY